ncbi:MAG: TRAP transporter fused permease subunit [Pseudomonadota bacterium]
MGDLATSGEASSGRASAAIFWLGLLISLVGLANVLPTYGQLPRIGPFAVEWFRPFLFLLAFLVCLVADANKRARRARLGSLHFAGYTLAAVAAVFVSWDHYRIGQLTATSVVFFGPREMGISLLAAGLSIWACWRIWGAPLALIGAGAILYLFTGQFWPAPFTTAPTDVADTISANLWYDSAQGILGSLIGVVLTTVLPFVILGALLESTGAAGSMISISFFLMRRLRGGPAHAAILASALFGTVSGSAVSNVVGTGVVTIPMIRKRGFSSSFAGAVEATASTGGQILPPIMGAAALVMADIVGVSYLTVIVAVLIPAVAYYLSLFLAVHFEAQRLSDSETQHDMDIPAPGPQDWLNLALVFATIAVILSLLVNGFSATGAGTTAILVLLPLSFLNARVRRAPRQLIAGVARGGKVMAELAMAIAIVGVIVSTLSATGVPTSFAVALSDASGSSLFVALFVAAVGCIVLGTGMPTLPAYLTIVSVMGPTLQAFDMDLLAMHLFVFFFGVAAGITPPVALTAFAAASVSGGRPIATALVATRVGAMIFLIPFAWAFDDALLIGIGQSGFLEMIAAFVFLLAALYFSTSALCGYDRGTLGWIERGLRLCLTAALLSPFFVVELAALFVGAVLVVRRRVASSRASAV